MGHVTDLRGGLGAEAAVVLGRHGEGGQPNDAVAAGGRVAPARWKDGKWDEHFWRDGPFKWCTGTDRSSSSASMSAGRAT